MKQIIMPWVALLATLAFAAPAWAQQGDMELAWNTCKANGGASDVTFPCGDGDGTPKASLFGSFSGAQHQPNLIAVDGSMDLGTTSALPDFFRFTTPTEPVSCNPGIAFSHDRPASCSGLASFCDDGTCDSAFGVDFQPNFIGNKARLLFTVFRTTTVDVAANTNYFVFKIDFYADAATESGGSCAGCSAQAAIVFDRLGLIAPAGYSNYSLFATDCATWNGGTSICSATPVKNRTWGALKSLYR